MATPTMGQIVHYQLTPADVSAITTRRRDAAAAGMPAHATGNRAVEGDVYPAVIVRVWGDSPDAPCNLQVLLDGTDTYWATSRTEGTEPGTWAWPERV